MAIDKTYWVLTRDINSFLNGSIYGVAHNMATDFSQWSYHNLILEMAFRHFCHILFAKSESLGPAYTQMERIQKIINTKRPRKLPKEVGITWAFLEASFKQSISVTWVCLAPNTELGKW